MYKSTFTIFLSFCFLVAFAQQPLSITVEKMSFDQNAFSPYKQVNFKYNKKGKLKSEQVLKWDSKQSLWENYSHWKKQKPSQENKSGIIVNYKTTKGKTITKTNASKKNSFLYLISESFFEKYNSVYTRRPDGKIITVSYDRCRSNVKVTFSYNNDGSFKTYLKEETHQYGEVTAYKGTFNYPEIEVTPRNIAASVKNLDVNVFPNPSTGLINVKLDYTSVLDKGEKVQIFVESLNGSQLEKVKVYSSFSTTPIDLSDYAAGMYVIKTVSGVQQNIQKVIITK